MRFRYLRDPVFLACFVLYFANRFVLKRFVVGGFFHEHLNDLICLPFWVPIMLFGMRKVGLRRDDGPPHAEEVLVPLIIWSVLFEVWLPRVPFFRHIAVADPADVFWYTTGGLLASVVWQRVYRERCVVDREPEAAGSAGPRT